MQTVVIALIIFLPIILAWLTVVLILKIAKALSQRPRKLKTRKPTALSQELNTAEIIFIVVFIFVFIGLAISLPKDYSFILTMMGYAFAGLIIQGWQYKQYHQKKHPTIEDIRRKYPKKKPVEIPTDGIYEDFSRELTPVEVETIELEVAENSYKTLLRMVYGDTDLAHHLITSNLFKGRSATWACEKAISDLERDRR